MGAFQSSEAKERARIDQLCGKDFRKLSSSFVDTFIDTVHARGPIDYHPEGRSDNAPAAPAPAPAAGYPPPQPRFNPALTPPPPTSFRLPAVERLVAMGDLHGDLEKAKMAFRLGGLTNANDQWIGGKTVVVQVGDQLDRGPDEVALMFFLDRLQREAEAAGGRVHVINGNHETLNVHGRFRYASTAGLLDYETWRKMQLFGSAMKARFGEAPGKCAPGSLPPETPEDPALAAQAREYRAKGLTDAWRARAAALLPGGPFTTRFFAGRPTILQVGSTVFAHGGVLPSHVEYGVDRINRETHQWMLGEAKNKPEFLQGKDAVVWSRHYSAENQARCECDKLTEALDKLPGAQRVVVGHTIQQAGINGACGNRVLRVDVGMSKGCGDRPVEVLEILRDGAEVRRLRYNHAPEVLTPIVQRAEGGAGVQRIEEGVQQGAQQGQGGAGQRPRAFAAA